MLAIYTWLLNAKGGVKGGPKEAPKGKVPPSGGRLGGWSKGSKFDVFEGSIWVDMGRYGAAHTKPHISGVDTDAAKI